MRIDNPIPLECDFDHTRKDKAIIMRNTLLLILLMVGSAAFLSAQTPYRLSSDHSIVINGTSNVHDWDEVVEKASGNAVISWSEDGVPTISSLVLSLDVESIKSHRSSIMDSKTYTALKSDKYPKITFVLQNVKSMTPAGNGSYKVVATGSLTLAGKSRTIDLSAKVRTVGGNKIEINGSEALKMTDYGISPPTALLGSLTTGDDVTIDYNITLVP
jgi:polyisoprenoid-binding protein YceI